jgi:hypothetical protein
MDSSTVVNQQFRYLHTPININISAAIVVGFDNVSARNSN